MRERQPDAASLTEQRKSEHIRICLEQPVSGVGITTGLEKYRFIHQALPEVDFREIDLRTQWLGKEVRTPLLISSMTGGSSHAAPINRRLAVVAEARGWAMGVGSVRAAVENPKVVSTFRIRDLAPTIPLYSNIGAVQLNVGMGVELCRRAVELVEADGLILHLNAMQEVFQPEGDVNFSGLLRRIEQLCHELDVPVGVKEVGWGIAPDTAKQLADVGVAFIDVAGAGGTSWSQVEKQRARNVVMQRAAEAFADWGIPTADSLQQVHKVLPNQPIIASGGLHTGVDAAKSIALGAQLAGFGRSLLAAAADSEEAVDEVLAQVEAELRITMFGIGARTIDELRQTDRLVRKP
ncbi:type 2 isopentenyl-diphosphate Delta-isomerase [Paenibacillus alvei]|uniref:type 2 isopentenyl-diphosphate Delta-isomerase n=1 Tax=Paenibacillus alvei TaxID=44250 RepID=UPI0013DC05A5|nr:type 2 isopentenyl-diphosphate Delta-isomerase [Paenibacillus alvei]NEZ43418.1 type 2 isopentenyl-diphosphate Delta-isomerase [Paenibacillus alvei]